MGIYDRDYYRDDSAGQRPGLSVTVWLIILHVGLFFGLALTTNNARTSGLIVWGGFDYDAIVRGEVWRLLTSHLIPSRDLPTILIGMFLLYWAGRENEQVYGSRLFLGFYLGAGLVAGFAKFGLGLAGWVPHPRDIGIAAPLFAVLVLYACHFPRQIVMLFFVLPVQVGHLVAALVGLYLFSSALSFGNGGTFGDAPSVLAAAAYAGLFYARGAEWARAFGRHRGSQASSRTSRQGLNLYRADEHHAPAPSPAERDVPPPPPRGVDEHLEAKLDEVLEKLAKFGPDRLSREENEVLRRASEAYQRLRK